MITKKTLKFSVCELPTQDDLLFNKIDEQKIDYCNKDFQLLYKDFPTQKASYASLQDRNEIKANKCVEMETADRDVYKKFKDDMASLTYGEISDVYPIANVLNELFECDKDEISFNSSKDLTFYDLGSGSGRVVYAAAMLFPFKRCIGIEILKSLHEIPIQLQSKYDELSLHHPFSHVEFYLGSILDLTLRDWTKDGNIIFINSTCFDNNFFTEISKIASICPSGTVFITLSQIIHKIYGFELLRESRQNMSWGMADFFIQVKK